MYGDLNKLRIKLGIVDDLFVGKNETERAKEELKKYWESLKGGLSNGNRIFSFGVDVGIKDFKNVMYCSNLKGDKFSDIPLGEVDTPTDNWKYSPLYGEWEHRKKVKWEHNSKDTFDPEKDNLLDKKCLDPTYNRCYIKHSKIEEAEFEVVERKLLTE